MTTQDFVKRLDLTGLTVVGGTDMNQMVDTATVADDKGLRIITTDNSDGSPNVPDPDVELEGIIPLFWKRYKWVRKPYAGRSETVREYNWNDNLTSDATYLKWEQFADIAGLEADIADALEAAENAETNATAAVTAATNATNLANTAQETAEDAQTTANLANSKADTNTASLDFYGGEITNLTNLYTTLNNTVANISSRITRAPIATFWLYDQKVQNTHGGTFNSGVWTNRDINFRITDNPTYDTYCELDSGLKQFTLAQGWWDVEIECPAVFVTTHQIRLINSDGVVYAYGTSASTDTGIAPTFSKIKTTIQIPTGGKTFNVQHYCTLSRADYGFGYAANIAPVEIYTVIKLRYLGV